MNLAAVYHRPVEAFILPEDRSTLHLELVTARDDPDSVFLLYWPRGETDPKKREKIRMTALLRDAYHSFFRARITVQPIAAYVRYIFLLEKSGTAIWYGRNGFSADDRIDANFFEFLWPNPSDCSCAPRWAESQIYYQIFPERFCSGDAALTPAHAAPWGTPPTRENFMGGDLRGILQKLDDIQSLGATCLYLTPIFKAPSNHKYDTADYFEIDPHFGTGEDLHRLVSEVHRRGMRILLDGVFNHCGYYWPPFQDVVAQGEASPYRSWFFIQHFPVTLDPCSYDCVGHYKWMPKINLAWPDARDYFLSVGVHWIKEFGIDGWRLDVADELPTAFLTAFSAAIRQAKPDALLLGETWGDAGRLIGRDRLDTAMNYLFRDAAADWLAKEVILPSQLDHRLNHMLSLYPEDVALRLYNPLDSHDTPRFRFLCRHVLQHYLAVALQMTFPGSPAIYYGDEIGLSGGDDPDCRMCMQWEADKQDPVLTDWYRKLIAIRSRSESLRSGSFQTAFCDDAANVYAFYRIADRGISLIVINAGENAWEQPFPAEYGCGSWYNLLGAVSSGEAACIQLGPKSVGIYQLSEKVRK